MIDEWIAALDRGSQIWWSLDGSADTVQLSCVRVGAIYWVGGRVRKRFTRSSDLRPVLETETKGLEIEIGKPRAERLSDPLLSTTHFLRLELGPGPGYEWSKEVRRKSDNSFEWSDITQVYDGMGAIGSTTEILDETEARRRIEAAYDEGYEPKIAKPR